MTDLEKLIKQRQKLEAANAILTTPFAEQLKAEFMAQAVIEGSVMSIGNIKAHSKSADWLGDQSQFAETQSVWSYENPIGNISEIVATPSQVKELLAETATVRSFVSAFAP